MLLDGHSTHYQPEAVRFAKDHDIIKLCLPPIAGFKTSGIYPCNPASTPVKDDAGDDMSAIDGVIGNDDDDDSGVGRKCNAGISGGGWLCGSLLPSRVDGACSRGLGDGSDGIGFTKKQVEHFPIGF